MRRRLDKGMQHVVAVARPGDPPAFDRPAMFLVGHHVGHDLAGVRIVGQRVDDGNRRRVGEFEQAVMFLGADHDDVDIARQHPRGIGDRLVAAQLHFGAGQHDRLAAKLAHGDIEGDAGSRRRLLEDHRQHLAGKRRAGRAALLRALAGLGVVENGPQVTGRNGGNIEKMTNTHNSVPNLLFIKGMECAQRPPCPSDRLAAAFSMRSSATRISSSVEVSGGRMRTTLSPAGTVSIWLA